MKHLGLPWTQRGMTRIERAARQCEFAIDRDYRTAYYRRKLRLINQVLQGSVAVAPRTDLQDPGVVT